LRNEDVARNEGERLDKREIEWGGKGRRKGSGVGTEIQEEKMRRAFWGSAICIDQRPKKKGATTREMPGEAQIM